MAARVQVAITTPELEEQTMKRQQIAFAFALMYLWVMMILLGSIVLETFMVYPNVFHDAPRSLEMAMEFMDLGQFDYDRVRRTVFDGFFLAPKHDHVHGRFRGALGCVHQASRPRVSDTTLVEARVQCGGFSLDIRGVLKALPS
jgi:hypothetical protein